VQHGRDPLRRKHPPLIIGDGNERHLGEFVEQHAVEGKVETAMQRGHRWRSQAADEREVKKIRVKMRDVDVAGMPADLFELHHSVRRRVGHLREAEGSWSARNELGRRLGVAAREERHLMSLPHQLLGQVGNNPLGAAIELRWNALDQW